MAERQGCAVKVTFGVAWLSGGEDQLQKERVPWEFGALQPVVQLIQEMERYGGVM